MKTFKSTLKVIAILLVFAGGFSSCDKIILTNGVWICEPEPNVTIKLTIFKGIVRVSTSPQDLSSREWRYALHDNNQYTIRGNKLYKKNIKEALFVISKNADNNMKLEYIGITPADLRFVSEYIFKRRK